MSQALPPGQTRILTFFADAEDSGHQPSRAEVAEAMGYHFPSAVSKHVDALVKKGLLEADRDKKRNVRLTETGWAAIGRTAAKLGVPVVGAIAAGQPILAAESNNGYLKDLQPAPGRFALKVRGDSMIEAGILDGDFAVIQLDAPVPDGTIGAVIIDNDVATLKRVFHRGDNLVLEPANAAYQPIVIPRSQAESTKIVGPLCFIYRTVT